MLAKIKAAALSAYRYVADHLTKWLGTAGLAVMSWAAWIDPAAVQAAASTYLGAGSRYYAKIGAFLFALVIARGWYTGWKLKQLKQQLAQQTA